jgi:hypothetical protein
VTNTGSCRHLCCSRCLLYEAAACWRASVLFRLIVQAAVMCCGNLMYVSAGWQERLLLALLNCSSKGNMTPYQQGGCQMQVVLALAHSLPLFCWVLCSSLVSLRVFMCYPVMYVYNIRWPCIMVLVCPFALHYGVVLRDQLGYHACSHRTLAFFYTTSSASTGSPTACSAAVAAAVVSGALAQAPHQPQHLCCYQNFSSSCLPSS